MLINISNHPSSEWESKQISEATALWGGVCDIAFPNICPTLDGDEVLQLAQTNINDYIAKINQYGGRSAFHVMGESVYCFHVIRMLKEAGYDVVASATERNAQMYGGVKLSHFSFVRFREY